jgi:hypothetical protein
MFVLKSINDEEEGVVVGKYDTAEAARAAAREAVREWADDVAEITLMVRQQPHWYLLCDEVEQYTVYFEE